MDLVFYKDNNYVIIEMNKTKSAGAEIKGRQYLYRKASHGFDTGNQYRNPIKVKLIMFNNYKNELEGGAKVIKYTFGNEEYKIKIEDIEMYKICLPIFREMCYDKCSEIDKRLWLFCSKNFEEMKHNTNSNETNQIIKELERLCMDDKFRDEYDYENVQRKLLNSCKAEGYEAGVKNGKKQGIEKVAKNMLNENIDINIIQD